MPYIMNNYDLIDKFYSFNTNLQLQQYLFVNKSFILSIGLSLCKNKAKYIKIL